VAGLHLEAIALYTGVHAGMLLTPLTGHYVGHRVSNLQLRKLYMWDA